MDTARLIDTSRWFVNRDGSYCLRIDGKVIFLTEYQVRDLKDECEYALTLGTKINH